LNPAEHSGSAGRDTPAESSPNWRALRRKSEFAAIYETGVKLVGRLFVLYMYPGDDLARAVVASRKIGGAVTRNRAKRLLREALACQIQRRPEAAAEVRQRFLPAADRGGLWIVAVARSSIRDVRCPEVTAELARLLGR
jgi:ribonuclease P protein component